MNNALFFFARILAWPIVNLLFLPKVYNKRNTNVSKKCIVIANHTSNWDPIMIGHLIRPANVHFMAKAELIENPMMKKFLMAMGIIPVERQKSDLKAVKTAIRVLKDGGVLGLFPEGHRSKTGELLPFESGVAIMALKTKTPVLPIYVHGNGYPLFHRVKVVVGEQFYLGDVVGENCTTEAINHANIVLFHKISELRALLTHE